MTATVHSVATLKRQRPEWGPWLAVVEEALREAESMSWTRAVPESASASRDTPRLAGTTIPLERATVARFLERLARIANKSGTPEMSSVGRAMDAKPDVLELFRAAVCHDADGVAAAAVCGADPDAFQAVAALLPVPFLQACNSVWRSAIPPDWHAPFCPVCGSWPAFAEVRGIERSRFYRCSRCGGEWHSQGLSCPYCANTDHRELVALVPEQPGAPISIEACKRCLGYVKTFNRLQPCPPLAVMVEELSGAALDVAALEHGYVRPAGAGYPLDMEVIEQAPRRSFRMNG